MSPPRDPERLIDSDGAVPPSLRRALGTARNVAPSRDALAALAAALPLGLGPAGPANPPDAGPTNPPDAGPPPDLGGAPGAGAAAASAVAKVALPSVLPGVIAGAVLGLFASGAWMAVTEVAPRPVAPLSAPARIERAAGEKAAPAAPSGTAIASSAPSVVVAPIAAPTVIASATAGAQETEADLLQRAHAQARTNPDAALALVTEHASKFPRGALGEESEVIAITALVSSGHTATAHARAERFFATFPGSAHRRRIEALFVGEKNQRANQNSPGVVPPTP